MSEDETRNEQDEGSSEETTDGPGGVTVDEPTETSLEEPHNDEAFRDGVPEPGRSESDTADS